MRLESSLLCQVVVCSLCSPVLLVYGLDPASCGHVAVHIDDTNGMAVIQILNAIAPC